MNSIDSATSTYTTPTSPQSDTFSDIEKLEKEIMIAKNDMLTAYHDKIHHFEPEFLQKLSTIISIRIIIELAKSEKLKSRIKKLLRLKIEA